MSGQRGRQRGIDRATRLRVADWIDDHTDAISDQAVKDIWEAVPAYRESGLEEDVAAHCHQVFAVFTRSIRDGREPAAEDFPWTAEHARIRVDAGIPLVDFIAAFRTGQRTLWEHLETYREESDDAAEVLLDLVTQLMRLIEAGSSAAASAYFELQQHQLADLQRVQRDVLEELLEGRMPEGALRHSVLAAAGLSEQAPFILVVAMPAEGSAPDDDGMAEIAARAAFALTEAGMFVARHREMVGLVPLRGRSEPDVTRSLRRLTDELRTQGAVLSVGLSTGQEDLHSVAEAYGEALLACEALRGRQGFVALPEVSMLTYLVHRPDRTARRLVRPEVMAFFAEDLAGDGTYADTIESYVAHDLSARATAKAMHVHPNTIYYRLERIATGTDTDLRQFTAIVELLVAVQLLRSE